MLVKLNEVLQPPGSSIKLLKQTMTKEELMQYLIFPENYKQALKEGWISECVR